jgi:hypothetical protein
LSRELHRHVADGGAALVASCSDDLARHAHRTAVLSEGRLHESPQGLVEPARPVPSPLPVGVRGGSS